MFGRPDASLGDCRFAPPPACTSATIPPAITARATTPARTCTRRRLSTDDTRPQTSSSYKQTGRQPGFRGWGGGQPGIVAVGTNVLEPKLSGSTISVMIPSAGCQPRRSGFTSASPGDGGSASTQTGRASARSSPRRSLYTGRTPWRAVSSPGAGAAPSREPRSWCPMVARSRSVARRPRPESPGTRIDRAGSRTRRGCVRSGRAPLPTHQIAR
jgi:hypothetical protein